LVFDKFTSKSPGCPVTKYEIFEVNNAYESWGDYALPHPDFEPEFVQGANVVAFKLKDTEGAYYTGKTYDAVIRATA
jgi:hypothetical protein